MNGTSQPRSRTLALASLSLLLFAQGCARNPTLNLMGSYFPSWVLCIALSSLLTIIIRALLRRYDLEYQLSPLVIVYPCIAASLCFTMWLLIFGVR